MRSKSTHRLSAGTLQKVYRLGYLRGLKRGMNACRDELASLAQRYDGELAGLQNDFQLLEVALLVEFHQRTAREADSMLLN